MNTFTDCRTDEGIIVGLIDGMIAAARIISKSNTDTVAIRESLKDFADDEDVKWMLDFGSKP